MAIVLLIKPAGLFGKMALDSRPRHQSCAAGADSTISKATVATVLLFIALVAPFVFYPVFLMKALCFALFACAFNLLIGYVGLLAFGHAAFFGAAAYVDRARG